MDYDSALFDAGICHFDLANNYGPEPGSAEENFGKILKNNLAGHRDELFISSKAGHDMWPGVYGDNSSRKNLMASCDQSLKRTGLEYFDIFYSHRYDGVTPVEETMQALIDIVRQGKALYVGISKYPPALQQQCYAILKEAHVPCLLSQYRCSMFDPQAKNEKVQQRHPCRQSCSQEYRFPARESGDSGTCGGREATRRHCSRARTKHCPNGIGLGIG